MDTIHIYNVDIVEESDYVAVESGHCTITVIALECVSRVSICVLDMKWQFILQRLAHTVCVPHTSMPWEAM